MTSNKLVFRAAAAALVAAAALSASAGDVFYWMSKADVWSDFTDSANWALSYEGESTGGRIPGKDDFIWNGNKVGGHEYAVGSFNLGGASNVVYGYSAGTGQKWGAGDKNWTTWWVNITNGVLEIRNPRKTASGTQLTAGHRYRVYNGATLIYSDIDGAAYEAFAPDNLGECWEIKKGGRGVMYGQIAFQSTGAYAGGVTVDEGGEFLYNPREMGISQNAVTSGHGISLENHGTFLAPGGVKITKASRATQSLSGTDDLLLVQAGGRMLLGGDFTKLALNNNIKGNMKFSLEGGTLEITNSVSFRNDPSANNASKGFYDEVSAEMPAGASATVDVKADSSVDMRLFTYGSGASLVKTGPGKMILKDIPDALSVNEGSVFFTNAIASLSGVSFAAGTTIGFMAADNAVDSLPNAASMGFALDDSFPGGVVVESADSALLETISAGLQLPAAFSEYRKVVSGGKLRLISPSDNTFSSDGEVDLGNAANWSGWLPTGGEAHLVGDTTVGLISSATPAFSSITVSDGATLKVSADTALPLITLVRDAKIVVAGGVWASLSNGLACTAIETALPVFEIATNATLAVPAGIQFKNVDLRHYGKIDVEPSSVTADNYIAFGTAANGETTYFAMTSIGGTVRFVKAADKALRFVHPDAGGRVKVKGAILVKDFTHDVGGNIGWNGPWFGVNNPLDEVFDVVIDNSDMEISRVAYSRGGARILFRNDARYVKLTETPGASARLLLDQDARVRFESGAHLRYSRCSYPLEINPTTAGTPTITVGDGGYVAIHEVRGNGKGVFAASNGCWCVDSLPTFSPSTNPRPPDDDARNWVSNAFSGFASVRIDPDSVLYLKSANVFNMTQWDRYTLISDIPMTGEGGLVLTNGVPGYGFAATMVNGANTATGRLSVAPSGDPTTFFFNDGANWAGTVQGDARIAFTNLTDAAAPATVSFAALDLAGAMPVRFWRGAGGVVTNDMVNLSAALSRSSAGGCIRPVGMSGGPKLGDVLRIGSYPASAGAPDVSFAARNWTPKVVATEDPDVVTLCLCYEPVGTVMVVR